MDISTNFSLHLLAKLMNKNQKNTILIDNSERYTFKKIFIYKNKNILLSYSIFKNSTDFCRMNKYILSNIRNFIIFFPNQKSFKFKISKSNKSCRFSCANSLKINIITINLYYFKMVCNFVIKYITSKKYHIYKFKCSIVNLKYFNNMRLNNIISFILQK